jgi:glutathione-regulated potassium-efflux system ancillary protein KefC
MHHETFLAVLILLFVTGVSVALFKRLGLGSVLGLLAAGVIVGPSGLELTTRVHELRNVSEIGVMFLLFTIGLEMHVDELWSMRREVFGLGASQVVLTGVLITVYTKLVFSVSWNQAVVVGLGLALSSTAFVMQLLSDRGETLTPQGRGAFAILLCQDLAVVPLLALIPILAGQGTAAAGTPLWQRALLVGAALAAMFLVGRYLLPAALRALAQQRNKEAFGAVTLFAVLGAAYAAETAGLSMAFGAFVMGMLLSGSDFRYLIESIVEPFKGVMLSLFFISVGMSIDFRLLPAGGIGLPLHLVAVLALKALVLFGLCLLFRMGRPVAVRVASLLPQFGEFGFVLFGAAHVAGLLRDDGFAFSILFISLSMVVTPPLAKVGDVLASRLERKPSLPIPLTEFSTEMKRHLIVIGYGRVGRTVCIMLERSGIPYVGLELNAARVSLARKEGRPVYFGDAGEPGLLSSAGVAGAAALVVTIDTSDSAKRAVRAARALSPGMPVIARARTLGERNELALLGVTKIVPDVVEASLQLGEAVLFSLGVPEADVQTVVDAMRKNDYAAIRTGGS